MSRSTPSSRRWGLLEFRPLLVVGCWRKPCWKWAKRWPAAGLLAAALVAAAVRVPLAELDPSNPRYPVEDAAGGDMPGGAWAEQQNAFFLDGAIADGSIRPGPCAVNCTNNYCGLPTRNYDDGEVYSFHPSGANCLLADGSVHFLRASIDIRVFAKLVTRAGEEVVSPGDF